MRNEVINKIVRYDYIDIAKGAMILLVVAGHIIMYFLGKTTKEPLFIFIYSFHMPLFFLLSGYVMGLTQQKIQKRSFFQWLWHKVITLLIPYIVWRLFVYRFIDPIEFSPLNVEAFRMLISNPGKGGGWFLISLFCIQLVCYPIFRYKSFYAWSIPLIFISSGMYLNLSYYYCNPYYYISFLAGFLLFKYKHKFLCPEIASLGLVCFIFFEINYPNPLICSFSAALALLYVCKMIEKFTVEKSFLYKQMTEIGKNTMEIYLIHNLFICSASMHHFDISDIRNTLIFVFIILISFIISLFCVGIAKIISFFPLLNLILFGKRTKNQFQYWYRRNDNLCQH